MATRKLWEANAIMAYLARAAGSDLWPARRPPDRGDALAELERRTTSRAMRARSYFQHIIKPHFARRAPDPKAVEEATGFFRQFAQVLNDHLRGRKYLLGDTLTIADFAVAVTLPYADKANIPVGGFSEIERWHARLNELPGWREPFPEVKSAAA